MTYHTFSDDAGSFETFHLSTHDIMRDWRTADGFAYCAPSEPYGEELAVIAPAVLAGWYWWPCFPGCLPDSDPVGPFQSENDAIRHALEG